MLSIAFRQLVGHGNHAAGPVNRHLGHWTLPAKMKFETGMENNTTADVDEPSAPAARLIASPSPTSSARFTPSAANGNDSFHADERRDAVRCPAPVACGITQHMLTVQLRELENDGLVLRTAFAKSRCGSSMN